MTPVKVRGLVIRTVDVKDSDRFVTLFTQEMGVVSAYATGARSIKSRKLTATVEFCYGDYVLVSRADKYWIKEAELIESFFELRNSIEGMALAAYILEVLCDVATAMPEKELLRLALNSLYAIANNKYSLDIIKGAFEIRTASILGFMPDVLSCSKCDERLGEFFFDIMGGSIECKKCHELAALKSDQPTNDHEAHIICILTEGAKVALGYCAYTPLEKIFSFKISDEDLVLFSRAAEEYLLNHLERSFNSLDFYKEVKR